MQHGIRMSLRNTPTSYGSVAKAFHWTIFLLIVCMLALGFIMESLPLSPHKFKKFLAHCGHAALYVLMIAMPLSGWAMSSASGLPVSVFGLFTLPDLVA